MRGTNANRVVAPLAAVLALAACSEKAPFEPDVPEVPEAAFSKFGPSMVLQVPEESPGPPFYSISANGGFIPNDGEWAAIPFLRELSCVPADQDLRAFPVFAAFGCQLTVEGHEHWQNGPGIDPAPRQTQFKGLGAVPIVFVRLSEVLFVIGKTGGLKCSALLALPSAIIGTAHFYKETDILGISGPHGAGKGMYKISARGTLADPSVEVECDEPHGPLGNSGSFRLHVNEVLGELRVVQIEFGS